MSYNGHLVVDTDSHIREYWDVDRTYQDFIDPQYSEKCAQLIRAAKAHQSQPGEVGFSEILWPRLPEHPMGVYDPFDGNGQAAEVNVPRAVSSRGRKIDPSCNWDPAIRLRDMDTAGIDVSVMFPSQQDGFCMLNDVGFESAMHQAYHRFMSNYCAPSGGRLRWLSLATMRDIPETVAQLQYWTKNDPNFAGMFLPRGCPDGSMLDNPVLHPLFAATQELDMPIWVHGGAHRPPFTPWVDAPNGLYHGWGGQYAVAGLIGGGVFDLFPKLRVGIFESGGGWLPWLVEKLDAGYHPGSKTAPKLKRKPSEIVTSGQFFVAFESDEELLEQAVEELGEQIWTFSTDYPHNGTCWPDGVPLITDRSELAESAKIAILGENAKRFLPNLAKFAVPAQQPQVASPGR